VIASLTGASLALFVVEPTVSGVHDFRRVAQLAVRLNVPGLLAVNKADLNEALARELETLADEYAIPSVGRIPFDRDVTRAQVARKTVVEASEGPAATAIRRVWSAIRERLHLSAAPQTGGLVQINRPEDN
jgi:MinD superfamily P-loop ATPase